jgi:uncharacterized protein YkwD
MKRWALIPLTLFLLLLFACGRGGEGPTAPAAVAPAVVEAESGSLLNETRISSEIDLLSFDPVLAQVARAHSEAMRDGGSLDHSGPGGGTLRDRLRAAGISFRSAGENLAQVQSAADPAGGAHSQLMQSVGHRANIVDPRFRLFGVGVAEDGGTYWITQIFIEP